MFVNPDSGAIPGSVIQGLAPPSPPPGEAMGQFEIPKTFVKTPPPGPRMDVGPLTKEGEFYPGEFDDPKPDKLPGWAWVLVAAGVAWAGYALWKRYRA